MKKFDMVAQHADALVALVEDDRWRRIRSPEYVQFSQEFLRVTRAVASAAREENVDAAALGWIQLSTQCFDCHRYVRDRPKE